ncbi:MAG TPA: hypothetical protein VKH42_17945, partial [Vicinamibacterales bacterium]|nr:hypothetical protein [Vicinamibacterales bacterium]
MRGWIGSAVTGTLVVFAGAAGALSAGQPPQQPPQGVGQVPAGPLPLSAAIREKGTSVTPAFEGWYFDKDGSQRLLVGYFNRNTKQELDIPVGPNNHIDGLGGPDQGQPTHFLNGRQWGVLSIKLPKDFGSKKLTWTLVANGLTSTITLHTKSDYIVEPYEDAANKNTPPVLKFDPDGNTFTGPPQTTAASYTATVGTPLPITIYATDEPAKINVREPAGRGRGRGTAAAADPDAADAGDAPARGAAPQGRAGAGAARGGRGAAGAAAAFAAAAPLSITWTVYRGPGAAVKFEPTGRQAVDKAKENGKQLTNVTFSQP